MNSPKPTDTAVDPQLSEVTTDAMDTSMNDEAGGDQLEHAGSKDQHPTDNYLRDRPSNRHLEAEQEDAKRMLAFAELMKSHGGNLYANKSYEG